MLEDIFEFFEGLFHCVAVATLYVIGFFLFLWFWGGIIGIIYYSITDEKKVDQFINDMTPTHKVRVVKE